MFLPEFSLTSCFDHCMKFSSDEFPRLSFFTMFWSVTTRPPSGDWCILESLIHVVLLFKYNSIVDECGFVSTTNYYSTVILRNTIYSRRLKDLVLYWQGMIEIFPSKTDEIKSAQYLKKGLCYADGLKVSKKC